MIVEPVSAHDLAVVTGNVIDPTITIRTSTSWIRRIGIDGVVTSTHHRPAVIVELTGKVERVHVAITLGRIVAVVLMSGDGVKTKSTICGWIDRKRVVEPHHHRLSVTSFQ